MKKLLQYVVKNIKARSSSKAFGQKVKQMPTVVERLSRTGARAAGTVKVEYLYCVHEQGARPQNPLTKAQGNNEETIMPASFLKK